MSTQTPVKVFVKTVINQNETYELTTFGHYYKKGTSAYLKYEESLEEGQIQTTVKLKDAEVLILRKGAVEMRLLYLLNKKTPGTYKTRHGVLATEVDTKQLKIEKDQVELVYRLSIQGSDVGTYHMKIDFSQEVKE